MNFRTTEAIMLLSLVFLLVFISDSQVETKRIFDGGNQSWVNKISPRFTENGIEKPAYERALDLVVIGPSRLFPQIPWLGYILIYGGLYILWLKWDIILTQIKRKIIFGKK